MIVYENFALATPVCVYGHWLKTVCAQVGLESESTFPGLLYQPPPNYPKFMLSVVRHPLIWMHSYFTDMAGKASYIPEIDVFREDFRGSQGRFDQFVQSYLRRQPGAISKMFDSYRPTSIMRCEDFPWAVIEFFQSLGIDEPSIAKKYAFSANTHEDQGGWMADKELRRDVVRAEQEFCLRLEYY